MQRKRTGKEPFVVQWELAIKRRHAPNTKILRRDENKFQLEGGGP